MLVIHFYNDSSTYAALRALLHIYNKCWNWDIQDFNQIAAEYIYIYICAYTYIILRGETHQNIVFNFLLKWIKNYISYKRVENMIDSSIFF